MTGPTLLAVPNVSEGRDAEAVARIGEAFASGSPHVRLLDVHSDADHHRSVFTLAGPQGALADALLAGARETLARVDVMAPAPGVAPGQHPHVGALDVAPLVYLHARDRGAACAEALVVGDRLGEELGVPVFLYGELSGEGPGDGRSRSQLRRGGVRGLAGRIASGECAPPDFGPSVLHPSGGATLVAAREPLVAFNVQLAPPAGLQRAREIAALLREGGEEGLPGVRAIGVELAGSVAQVSTNVERPLEVSLARVVAAVARHAPVLSAELVGLAPAAAFEGFPADVPIPGFDPAERLLERVLGL